MYTVKNVMVLKNFSTIARVVVNIILIPSQLVFALAT
jgi:hypothetical protein